MKISLLQKDFSIYLFALILLILVLVRFLWLDMFPVGMYHDEVEYILSAKSYAIRGSDLSGYGFPESLFKTKTDGLISPVTPMLLAPYTILLELNQVSARIPFVFINILSAGVVYFLGLEVFKRRKLALISSLVFLINPWSFYLSRYAGDSPLALLFVLAGIVGLLKLKNYHLVWPIMFFILGFFSYHGAKLIILPAVLVCVLYRRFLSGENKFNNKEILGVLGMLGILYLVYFGISFSLPGSILESRSDDLFFQDVQKIARQVDEERRLSIESPVRDLFSNKFGVVTSIGLQKYLTAFSTDVLFFTGDDRATYRFGGHGFFFWVDGIFLVVGFLKMFVNRRKLFWLLLGLGFVAPLSTAVSGIETSVIHRSFLLLPVLVIFLSYGIYEVYAFLRKIVPNFISFGAVFLIVAVSSLNFFYFYFFRFPVTQQESYFLSERALANFLKFDNGEVMIISSKPIVARSQFLETLFYMGDKQDEYLTQIYDSSVNVPLNLGPVEFGTECPEEVETGKTYITGKDIKCNFEKAGSFAILDQKDSGEIFRIYNSQVCQGLSEKGYRRFNNLEDYSIESLDKNEFCKTWIEAS